MTQLCTLHTRVYQNKNSIVHRKSTSRRIWNIGKYSKYEFTWIELNMNELHVASD